MTEPQVSMVNVRGRVVWVDESKVSDFRDMGWRIIVNPKESYYPQYDQTLGTVKEDQIGGNTHVLDHENYGNKLGIIVL